MNCKANAVYGLLMIMLMICSVFVLPVGTAHAQSETWYAAYDNTHTVPPGGSKAIDVPGGTGGTRYTITVEPTPWWACIDIVNPADAEGCIQTIYRTGGPWVTGFVASGGSWQANVNNTSGSDITFHIVVEFFGVDPSTIPTVTPMPTNTPTSTPIPPTPTASGPSGPGPDGTPGTGDDTCAGSSVDPCHVIVDNFPTQAPYPTVDNALFCGAPGLPPCRVQDINTPMPSATPYPAMQTAIAFANNPPSVSNPGYSPIDNPFDLPSDGPQGSEGVAGWEMHTYDIGCPIDIDMIPQFHPKLCIKYVYVSSIRFSTYNIDLTAMGLAAMFVSILVWIVKR